MQLCIGTAQFGMDYGIHGQKRPRTEDSVRMLDYATQNGICQIDTANAYGDAEEVVGAFLKGRFIAREKLTLVTKVKPNCLDDCSPEQYYDQIKKNMEQSMSRLGTDYIDVYLFHSARYVFDAAKLEALGRLKNDGYVKKVGVSVYNPNEALAGLESRLVDFLQLPYSIFDQRMNQENIFTHQNIENTQINVRSAFIQGLITMDEYEVPPFLEKARPIVAKVHQLCRQQHIDPVALALQYVKQQKNVSHLVFAVDSMEQLKQDIEFFTTDSVSQAFLNEIAVEFEDLEAEIVMPSLWHKPTGK